ncbi:GGDEF domain-containing protein [Paraburkholderia sp. Clong3]|uniref:hypothetical protein n=1 Tax=unclassified Paraburkholderia TaxID=2615204 RepID=UPI0016563718|nr:hypothetical protein [Paraburkholderia sp. UCT2]MBC8728635.1 hypothetical protein [Paraburkholderia sp. UCT2]
MHDADLFVFIAYPDRVTRAIFKDSVRLTISGGVAIMPRGIEHAYVKMMSKTSALARKKMPKEAFAMHPCSP